MNGVKVLIVAVSRNREGREALFMCIYIYFESGGSIIIILVQITNHQIAHRCRCQVRHELIREQLKSNVERPSLKLDTKNLVNEINVQ